ncbi:molybdopterin-dependent oxidoreductase [Halorarum halophilum]|uniref:Molybdopterin-dependent oxidoreductase n=1 Tax=Halorarum halophilum TaxID=2743090 RepID=A0A7D5KW66_9EURY|nr:molybdopterin-dependent oxidoreductase [Halobaculum halophilum]QLG26158.1 molybdopterin-dependent oxidoreductase [Halobaculum halophilum]
MNRPTRRRALVTLASGVGVVAGSFLVAGFAERWVVLALARTLFFLTPDGLVAFGIQRLGDLAQPLLVVGAGLTTVLLFGGLAFVTVLTGRALDRERAETVFAVGTVQAFVAFALTVAPLPALVGGAVGAAVVGVAGRGAVGGVDVARRDLLRSLGTAAATVGLAGVLGVRRGAGGSSDPKAGGNPAKETSDSLVRTMLSTAEDRSLPLADIDPLVSERFYQVDINPADPDVDRETWSLTVSGAVEGVREYSLADLEGRPAEHRFVTLRCVGDSLNGKKLDNALWTGVPMTDVLEEVGVPDDEPCCVYVRAADGYFQSFPLEAMRSAFLAYGMNGRSLPKGHGAPVRALVPGHWGEINVKWLTEIEVVREEREGYWEKRGWHGTGPVNTVAKLHSVDASSGSVTVGGHAYAGTRGVSAVEVSTDGGESWTEATLSERLPAAIPADADPEDVGGEAADAWRMWRHEYEATGGHEVVVRAVEADGTVQDDAESKPFPSGASGWVSRRVAP